MQSDELVQALRPLVVRAMLRRRRYLATNIPSTRDPEWDAKMDICETARRSLDEAVVPILDLLERYFEIDPMNSEDFGHAE